MKLASSLVVVFLSTSPLFSQHLNQILESTNVEFLSQWAKEQEAIAIQEKNDAIQFCEENGLPISLTTPEGAFAEVIGFDETGKLQYAITENNDAAKTISANKVQSYGLPNFNLSGRGFTAGVWDGGRVRGTHQEFTGRVTYGDNNTNLENHATHVAGTVIAQGVNNEAKGMANEASLVSYDWTSPISEQASAAINGILVSNHSWGYINGWAFGSYSGNNGWHWWGDELVSPTEDYAFGRYDDNAAAWDVLAYNAPFFTIVKSAGNERNNNGPSPGGQHYFRNTSGQWTSSNTTRDPDGNFDCQANMTLAKNVISVGAVNPIPGGYVNSNSVVMSGFSSWGPSDDSRVKPDLVANGVDVLSSLANSNTSYASWSGTSMSGPTITGSVLLLQEHYSNVNSGYIMRSETVKSLLIHTCDEAGIGQGPDYSFGWGLANIHKAAEVISEERRFSLIEEEVLIENQTKSYQVYSDGSEPLKATIVWLDPEGNPAPLIVNHPNPVLVNDLDLRIISTSDTTFPWKLSAASPSAPATKGDNIVDNVEVVEVPNPAAGNYTITVSHKDSLLFGTQSFTLVVTGIKTADSADHCNPLTTFNSFYGQFSDGSGDDTYSNNQECNWRINAKPGATITLRFKEFNLGVLTDFVRIYDGPDNTSPVLGTFAGSNNPGSFESSGNEMYVSFKSDGNDGGHQGFLATYATTTCNSMFPVPNTSFSSSNIGDSCDREVRFIRSTSNFDSLFWDYGNGETSIENSANHVYSYPSGGLFEVTQIAYGRCLRNDTAINQVIVPCEISGIDGTVFSNHTIYPNPSNGKITIQLSQLNASFEIRVYDLNGALHYSKFLNQENSDLDISHLPSGGYIYELISNQTIQRGKLIKQ